MRNLWVLTRREVGTLFLTPSLHVVTAFFVLLYGLYFSLGQEKASTLEPLALLICFMSIFLVPLITMRSFAEETNAGTLELLLTAPVGAGEVVLSKFLGCFLFYLATLLPCLVYVALLAAFGDSDRPLGNLDRGEVLAGLVALVCIGALYTALGVLLSSLTASQIVAEIGRAHV
jgi:ABC-2 type transport system permease protein